MRFFFDAPQPLKPEAAELFWSSSYGTCLEVNCGTKMNTNRDLKLQVVPQEPRLALLSSKGDGQKLSPAVVDFREDGGGAHGLNATKSGGVPTHALQATSSAIDRPTSLFGSARRAAKEEDP
jgi:hypothetical protein